MCILFKCSYLLKKSPTFWKQILRIKNRMFPPKIEISTFFFRHKYFCCNRILFYKNRNFNFFPIDKNILSTPSCPFCIFMISDLPPDSQIFRFWNLFSWFLDEFPILFYTDQWKRSGFEVHNFPFSWIFKRTFCCWDIPLLLLKISVKT